MDCNGCTACCKIFPIQEIDKPINVLCKYCDKGCTIHNSKPQTCNEFECAYYQSNNAPLELRPDKCGVMFYKKTDRIFVGVFLDGNKHTDIARGQIESFKNQGYSVILLFLTEKPIVLTAEGHSKEDILKEYKEVLKYGDI